MVNYDAEVIQKFADQLYLRARRLAWKAALMVLLPFGMANLIMIYGVHQPVPWWMSMLVGVPASGVAYWFGWMQGFKLRLEAQRALVLVEIERNTRKSA